MTVMNTWLPFASSAISFVFALLVFRRYLARRGPHLLLYLSEFLGAVLLFIGFSRAVTPMAKAAPLPAEVA